MNKATVLKSVTAVVGAGVAAYCGQLAAPVLVLLCMMVIDYVTGMVKAYMTAQLSSRIGVKGILKKLCYMAMVAVGASLFPSWKTLLPSACRAFRGWRRFWNVLRIP